jgi:hypothetical protein
MSDRAGTAYRNPTGSHPVFGMVRVSQHTFVPSPPAGTEPLERGSARPPPGRGDAAANRQDHRPALGVAKQPAWRHLIRAAIRFRNVLLL